MSLNNSRIIVFAIDSNYLPHLAVALESFVDCHSGVTDITIGLIYKDIPENNIEELVDFFSGVGLKIVCHCIEQNLPEISVGYHFNQTIFYRFLAPEIFSRYSKILYLDSDIVFTGNASKIFDVELGRAALGAVEKTGLSGVPQHLKEHTKKYFASGLLLIDSVNFREQNIKNRCFQFLKTQHYEMPDQDALSAVVQDFVPIDPRYSVETAFLGHAEPEYDFANNPVIVQFSGSSKPWQVGNNHPYKKLYWHYRNKTPYKSWLPDDFSLLRFFGIIMRRLLKGPIRNFGRKARLNF